MRRYIGEEKSGMGGGGIAALIVLVAVTAGAFFATDAGAFKNAPTARIAVLSAQNDVVPGAVQDPVDRSSTSSSVNMSKAAEALCNSDACARAYRSFRSSDCTFQPFEGPRRVCTR